MDPHKDTRAHTERWRAHNTVMKLITAFEVFKRLFVYRLTQKRNINKQQTRTCLFFTLYFFTPAEDSLLPLPLLKPTYEKLPLTSQPLSINHTNPALAPFLLAEGLSSMETLLTNIQVTELTAIMLRKDHRSCKDDRAEMTTSKR